MEFQGTVFKIMPETKGVSQRGEWQRQDVIFEYMDGAYMRKLAITFFNKPADVQILKVGESYNVSFNVESREYQDRWYTDVRAWRVTPASATAPSAEVPMPQQSYAQPMATAQPAAPAANPADEVDDLPF